MFENIYSMFKDILLFCINFHVPKENIGTSIDIYPFWLCLTLFVIYEVIDFCFPDKKDD